MTIWNKIYRDYRAGGPAYATLGEDLIPEFLDFLAGHDFPNRLVLDVGCGNGKYLDFLRGKAFIVEGLDSSPIAVAMAREALQGKGTVIEADMYEYKYPVQQYCLVISIAALHHGRKHQVRRAVQEIYSSLVPGGYFFVTLPDNSGSEHWSMMVEHEEIEPGTRVPLSGPERGLPHASYTEEELDDLFKDFANVEKSLLAEPGKWVVSARK